jgi:hypothetical protein
VRVNIVSTETTAGMFLQNFHIKKCRLQFEDLGSEQCSGIDSILSGRCLP